MPANRADSRMASKDRIYQNAMRNVGKQEARIESRFILQSAICSLAADNTEFFKQFNNSAAFKKRLSYMEYTAGLCSRESDVIERMHLRSRRVQCHAV
jgi:hypothetical protein